MRNEKDWQGYGGSLYLLPRKTRQIEKIFNPQLCNAFNRCAGLGYWYQDSDITAIAKLLLKDFENIELIEAIGRSQYQSVDAKEILKNKKEKLETGKKLIGIYNTEGKHWIAFIIFNGAAGKITCVYKDSLGEKRDDFESDIKQAFGEETSISCLAEGQAEQTEELDNAIADNKGLVSCGIFALKNLGILTSCANFGEAEFYNPGKNLEEYECNIRAARREYGLLYARSTYDSLQESEIRLKDLFIELKITSEQKKDDELLKDLSEALCIDLEEVRKALVVGEKLEDVNSSGKPSEAGGNSDTATQDNAGKSSGAPLKAQEPDKEILDERLVRADALPFKDEDGQLKAALKGLLEVSKEVHPRITIGLLRIIHTLQVHWEMPELTEEVNAAFMKCNRLIYNYRVSNKDKKSSSVEGLIEDRVDFLEAAEEKAKIIESPLLSEKNKEWLPDFPAFVNQDEEGANDPKSRKSEKRKKVLAHDKIKQLSGKSYDNGLLTYADILTKEKAYIDAVKCCDLLRYRKEKGSEEYREAEKKLHEVEARLILDLLNCPGNLDTRELGSREKEGATYGSNKQLISKLERIGDMFLQAGKYRAATNLYHELLSIIQKLQEDGEYKYNAQLRQSEKFIPRELFTIEKRVFIKFAGACRGERKLENLDKHKVKLEDIRRKQSLSLSTEHNLLKVQQEWNSSFAELLKDIVREAEVQLGEGYECAIVSIGSLARGEASLYSDIDLMIILKDEIVDNNACEKYFRALIDLIKIKIISLGEMPSLPDSIDEQGLSEAEKNKKLHYDKAGFFPEIKGSGLEKYNLIRILREGGLPAEKCLAEMLSLDPQEETRKLLESYKDAFKGKINRYKEQLLKEIQETSFKFFPTNIEKVKELLIESLNSDKLKDKKDYHAVIQAILSLHPEEETKKFLKAHEEVLEGKIKEDKGQLLEEMKEKSFRFFHTSIGPVEELLLENDKLKDKWEYHAAIQDVLLLNSGKEAQELLSQYHDVLTKRNKIARGRITNQLELAAFKLELGEGCKGINIKNDILRYPMLLVNRLFAYYDLKLEKISEDQTITEQKIDALVAESKKRKIDLEKLEGWEDFLLYCFSKERAKGLKKWLKLGHELRIKAHYLHESSQDSSEKVFVDEEAGVIYLENEDGRRDVCTLEKLQKLHAKQMQPLYRLVELWGKLIGVKSEERLSTILREESVELLQEYERSGNIEYANQANWYYEKAVGFDLDGSERDWRKSIEELCDKNGKAGHKLSFLNHQGVLRTWSLKEEVEKQLLDLNNHEIDGRRPTVKLKVNGHYFHIKKCPEAPGTEYAVSSLSHLLFGYTTAHFSMLAAVMNRENKMFPVLISRTVIGTKLDCETEDTLKDIDSESFGLSFIRTILTNPGDDQGANHVVQATRDPIGKVKRRLICIDGDHGLLEESITGDVCLLKSIVYCAQQMQEKIPDEVKERVSKINPEILIAWLTKIISMDEYNRNLNKVMYDHDKKFGMLNRWFTSEESYLIKVHEIEKHGEKEEVTVTIPILFNENIVNNVCYKLMQLQDLFGAGAESNYFRVLRMMYLQVANHYEKAFLEPKNNTPGKRFKSISKGQYEERTAPPVISIDESGVVKKTQVKYSTTKTRYYASLAEKINAKQFGQQIYTPIQAFDKLNSLIITINDLPKIREQIIEEGIIDAELPLEIRQMVINGRESMGSGPFVNNIFKAIAKKHADDEEEIKAKQRKVLELIKAHFSGVNYYAKFTREFKRINLSNCVELKDKDLNKILSERTEWLDITGCNQLTIAALSIIAKKCKKLETLYVSHDIKDIGWLKGTKFKVLRKLSIIDCKKITNQWDKVIEACQNLQQLHLTDQGFIEVVKTGNLNLVKITNCRNINAQDKDGKTPLHWVAANGHKEIVELLLANKANIEAVANNGGTPLMFAAHNGHKEIVELLLANKANIEAKDKEGNTSLHYAVSNGHEEIVELLLEKDADIKIENMKGFVALDLAFRYLGSNIETIKLLCEQDPNAIGKDEKTPLMWAVMNEKEELVDFLLKKGADVEAKDNKGNTALDLAFSSQNSNIKIITLLCEKDPNAIGKDGNTALDLAFSFRGSNIETIKLLCEQDPNAIGKDGRTPLMWAVIRNNRVLVEFLLEKGAYVEAKDNKGNTALDLAFSFRGNNIETIKLLCEQDPNAIGKDGRTPLMWAVIGNNRVLVEFLLEKGAYVEAKDKDGNTALDFAFSFRGRNIETIKLLCEQDPNAIGKDGKTPLMWAVIGNNRVLVEFLLERKAKIEAKDDHHGATPLHHAADGGHIETAAFLLKSGAKIEAKDYDDITPLCYAIYKERRDMVKLLLDAGADINTIDLYGDTPLHWAAYKGNLEVVSLLCESLGNNLDAPNQDGETALMLAAGSGEIEITKFLIRKGASIRTINKYGNTVLHLASWHGGAEIVRILLGEQDMNLDIANKDGKTALDLAIEKGHEDIADLIRSKQNQDQNLRRSEQELLRSTIDAAPYLRSIFTNIKETTELSKRHPIKAVNVLLIPENNHCARHASNTYNIMRLIEGNQISQNTVIALERKQLGNSFGMPDVISLASNIDVPEFIKGLPIYQDAKLYNLARLKGITVIGIEGKGLPVSKESPLYNQAREDYMASKLMEYASLGYNVIFPVGSAHVEELKSQLEAKGINVSIRNYSAELAVKSKG